MIENKKMKKDMKKQLELLAKKDKLTAEDKEAVKALSVEITATEFIPKSGNCKNCYYDKIFELLNFLKNKEAKEDVAKNKKVRMVEPHGTNGLLINGVVVNNDNVHLHVEFLKSVGMERFIIE